MKKVIGFVNRHRVRVGSVVTALLVLAFSVAAPLNGLAANDLFYPAPASGSYSPGSQFTIGINYTNPSGPAAALSVTITPGGGLQYVSASFNESVVYTHQATVNGGSVKLAAYVRPGQPSTVTFVTVTLKSTGAGQGSLVLSAGTTGFGQSVPTQNGSYNIQAPAPPPPPPAPTPAPTPTPTPPKAPTPSARATTPSAAISSPTASTPTADTDEVKTNQTDVLPLIDKSDSDSTGDNQAGDTASTGTTKTKKGSLTGLIFGALTALAIGGLAVILIARRRRKKGDKSGVVVDNVAPDNDDWTKDPRGLASMTLGPLPPPGLLPTKPDTDHVPQNFHLPTDLVTAPTDQATPKSAATAQKLPAPPPKSAKPTTLANPVQPAKPAPTAAPPKPLAATAPSASLPPLPTMAQPIPPLPPLLPLPPAANPATHRTVHSVPGNSIEAKIDHAFYPLDSPLQAPVAAKPTDEPLDMFEMAQQHPASFGNDLYVEPPKASPTTPPKAVPPAKPK